MSDTQPNKGTHGEEVSRWFDHVAAIVFDRSFSTKFRAESDTLTATLDIPFKLMYTVNPETAKFKKALENAGFQVSTHYIDTDGKEADENSRCQGIRIKALIPDSPEAMQHLDTTLKAATHDAQVDKIRKAITGANEIQDYANSYYQGKNQTPIDSLRDALGEAVKESPLQSTIILKALPTPVRTGLSDVSRQGALDINLGKTFG